MNAFWRKLGVVNKWQYTNDIMTAGTGSPILSKEMQDLLIAVRRRELREGTYEKTIAMPVLSSDYTYFNDKVVGYSMEVIHSFINNIMTAEASAGVCPSTRLAQSDRSQTDLFDVVTIGLTS